MEGLKLVPYIALIITISGIVIGASVLSLSGFGDTVDKCRPGNSMKYNATLGYCCNATGVIAGVCGGVNTTNATIQYQSVLDATEGNSSIAEQLPTVAIIAVMVIILSMIGGIFVYFRYFR